MLQIHHEYAVSIIMRAGTVRVEYFPGRNVTEAITAAAKLYADDPLVSRLAYAGLRAVRVER